MLSLRRIELRCVFRGVGDQDEPSALIDQVGFRVCAPKFELSEDECDYQAVLAYQGAIAYVHLAERSTCPNPGMACDWRRPPRLEEDVMPIVRAFYEASQSGAGVRELRGTLDLIFAREPRSFDEDALPFQIYDGAALISISRYLDANPRPDLIQLEERMAGLSAGPYGHRAGDVLLLAKSGEERPIEDRYYFSSEYRSWHGSPSAQDSYVPLLIGRSGQSVVAPFVRCYRPRNTVLVCCGVGVSSRSAAIQLPSDSNVSHAWGLPVSNPLRNHRTRCSDEPCVKASGWTARPAMR